MKIDFANPEYSTTYSFESPRVIIRTLSDAFSKQHCDVKGALIHASKATQGKCLYCGKPMYVVKNGRPQYANTIHYDHIYPASKLNLFEVGNIAIACNTCNLAKSDKFPMEYYDMRAAEGTSLYEYDRDVFEKILDKITEPYRKKWPKHFEVGSRELDDEADFKALLTELLYDKVDIASASTKYNHEHSVNRAIWTRVVEKAYDNYSSSTAKDVEGRIGYTNAMFEDTFGHGVLIEDVTVRKLSEFVRQLLLSKYESKNEIQKYRMLIKLLVEVLNEDLMEGQLEGFYAKVPTYAKINAKSLK